MAAKYVVTPNEAGNYDVLFAQVFPKEELSARYQDMIQNGWTEAEASAELAQLTEIMKKCNENPEGYDPKACLEFIASYAEAGDILIDRGGVFVVLQKVCESQPTDVDRGLMWITPTMTA